MELRQELFSSGTWASAVGGPPIHDEEVVSRGTCQHNHLLAGLKTSSQLQYGMSGMRICLRAVDRVREAEAPKAAHNNSLLPLTAELKAGYSRDDVCSESLRQHLQRLVKDFRSSEGRPSYGP